MISGTSERKKKCIFKAALWSRPATGRQSACEESWFYEYAIKFALGIPLSVVANDP